MTSTKGPPPFSLDRRALILGAVAATAACANASGRAPKAPSRLVDWRPGFAANLAEDAADHIIVPPAPRGPHGAVACTGGAAPAHIANAVLRAGGSAADAVIAGTLANITLAAGSYISFAGFMLGMHFDAVTGRTESLDGQYDIPRAEADPSSIPGLLSGIPSGRTALVPGCMAGLQALHDRYGRLPWADLVEPSLALAEEGFLLSSDLAERIEKRKSVLARLPETRAVFFKEDGSLYRGGELFRQPALAKTLRGVAQRGADYMYRGPWAERLIEALQREGGRMTLADLAAYSANWAEPLAVDYHEYQFATVPRPNIGGLAMAAMLNMLEAADIRGTGNPKTSAQSLYNLLQVRRAIDALAIYYGDPLWYGVDPRPYVPGVDLSDAGLRDKANGRKLWNALQTTGYKQLLALQERPDFPKNNAHTASISAVDAQGNVAAVTHTINTINWGNTGIFVDGVSIPDSASFQQVAMQRVNAAGGPGGRLPTQVAVFMALKAGRPFMAAAAIGQIFEVSLQSTLNMLDFGMDPQQAIESGQFVVFRPETPTGSGVGSGKKAVSIDELAMSWGGGPPVATVQDGAFSAAVLARVRELGQPIEEAGPRHASGLSAVMIDKEGMRSAGVSRRYYRGGAMAF